jgi:outer membrane protein
MICTVAGLVSGQQLTRFAVVDLPRVYTSFFRDSRAVREFEERSSRVQSEVDRYTREIQELRVRHSEAMLGGNHNEAGRLELDIHRRTTALNEYFQSQTAILEDQRRRLMQSDTFFNEVHGAIRHIAESEGYSMVLNLKDNTGIIWFSPTVDITDKVITNLQSRR